MKKIINAPENYVDDMLKGIYAAHSDEVKYAADDLRCYCRAEKVNIVLFFAIITQVNYGMQMYNSSRNSQEKP